MEEGEEGSAATESLLLQETRGLLWSQEFQELLALPGIPAVPVEMAVDMAAVAEAGLEQPAAQARFMNQAEEEEEDPGTVLSLVRVELHTPKDVAVAGTRTAA